MTAVDTLTLKDLQLDALLQEVIQRRASDLHLSVGLPPVLRIDGQLVRMEYPPLNREQCHRLIFSILTNDQRRDLEQEWELDCSYGLANVGRFRVNVYRERGTYAAALRTIVATVPTFKQLGLPEVMEELAHRERGLILVTGATGSGKSTTLAALVDHINTHYSKHILTIEDPVEFVHTSKRSIIHQRELGMDTHSFAKALKSALREDPDVILVGEMRDLETIQLALSAAETGHLVLGTLHTSSAAQTVDRIVDVFPPEQHGQVRTQLSNSLIAVFSQVLLPKLNPDGMKKGRVMAQEILLVNSAVSNLIREAKSAQIYSVMQTGGAAGMQTLESALKKRLDEGVIELDDAVKVTSRPKEFQLLLNSSPA
ncbi:MAG: type IV pilus twitching motility protein PilT [Vampirovibrionales bacterium]|nr:type IV pilus twitching motility protein PilT [Vampirovibrionales bacterium]